MIKILLYAPALVAAIALLTLLAATNPHPYSHHPKPQTRRDQVGLLGLFLDQLLGPKNSPSHQQPIRSQRGPKVDVSTGEVLEKSRKVIIGWIDRETGEITPNPEASRIAKEKGALK